LYSTENVICKGTELYEEVMICALGTDIVKQRDAYDVSRFQYFALPDCLSEAIIPVTVGTSLSPFLLSSKKAHVAVSFLPRSRT
jgi:hypothetical protein